MILKVDEEFKDILPELSTDEYTELERSVVKDGVLSPIIVWDDVILDGHNRYEICQAHRIENFPVKEMTFADRTDALLWILRNQLGRRNLTDFHRNKIALKYEEAIAAQMKERADESRSQFHGNQYREVVSGSNEPHTTKRKELAKIAGTSEGSIQRTKLILDKGTPEQIERAEKGGKGNSVSAIAKEIAEAEKPVETRRCVICGKDLPLDRFDGKRDKCRKCRKVLYDNANGGIFKLKPVSAELARKTDEEIAGNLYGDKEVLHTIDDFITELGCHIDDFQEAISQTIDFYDKEYPINDESKASVWETITLLRSTILQWKEMYEHE